MASALSKMEPAPVSLLRNVVVTGAGSGIGRALCIGFSSDGHRVIGVGRRGDSLESTAKLCADGNFFWRALDVADADAVAAGFAAIEQEHGPIDALISNAAIYQRRYFLDMTAQEWTSEILINLCGAANCCHAVLPGMLQRQLGRIVIIGSLADLDPIPASSAYSASKGGLHALVKALASEIDRIRYPNVLVNELNPGATRTAMSEAGHPPEAVYPAAKRLLEAASGGPTGRMFGLDREIHVNEGLKAKVKRLLFGRLFGR